MKYQNLDVEQDRFYLNDPCKYSIYGLIPEDFTLAAQLDGEKIEITWKTCEPRNAVERLKDSETPHAQRVDAWIMLPEDLDSYKKLMVYAVRGEEKRLWFQIKTAELKKKRGKPQFFIEEERIDRKAGTIVVSGWAAAKTHVSIRVFDMNKKPIACKVQRLSHPDVAKVYAECPIEEECGFCVEMDGIPGKCFYLVMRAQDGSKAVYRVGVSRMMAFQGKAARYGKKGVEYFRTHGARALLRKCMNKAEQFQNRPMDYGGWLSKHLPSDGELAKQRKTEFARNPLISVLVRLEKPNQRKLEILLRAMQAQTYRNWELCIARNGNLPDTLINMLKAQEESDERIRVFCPEHYENPAVCCNELLEKCRGDYMIFVGQNDQLAAHALFCCVEEINKNPDTDVIYSDEDRITVTGSRFQNPIFKPDFNADLLYTTNYISHLFMVKKELLEKTGAFREEFKEAMEYDWILRCVEQAARICHIPKILYHWSLREESGEEHLQEEQEANLCGMKAVQAHFDRMGIPATVYEGEYPGLYRTRYQWEEKPLVSILIPTKDHIEDLERCISSIEEKSTYRNFEYILIENNSTDERTFAYYKELEAKNPKVHVVYWEGPFNYSAINNFGASFANGDYYLLLNNDTEVISPDWIEEMLGYCMRPDVGIVGARLYYDDDTVQHAGVILGFGSIAGHCFIQQPRGNSGYQHRIISAQDYSAVTAACMMVDKKVFEEVGGLSTELAVAFNDVDFCLKVGAAGYRVVYNPYVELYHYESKSRGLEDTPEKKARFNKEIETLQSRWPDAFSKTDPYYNPNLTLKSQDFSLKRI